jgi:hypothetical protein
MSKTEPTEKSPIVNVVHRIDGYVDDDTVNQFTEDSSRKTGIPIFNGHIIHAYESDFTKQKTICPRCAAPTQQMYSNFAYATQVRGRVSNAAAGYFCTECPTVIIDDDIMRESIDTTSFQYGGVYVVEKSNDRPCIFRTHNGKTTAFIMVKEVIFGLKTSVNRLDLGSAKVILKPIPNETDIINKVLHKLEQQEAIDKAAADKRKAKAKAAKKARKASRK